MAFFRREGELLGKARLNVLAHVFINSTSK